MFNGQRQHSDTIVFGTCVYGGFTAQALCAGEKGHGAGAVYHVYHAVIGDLHSNGRSQSQSPELVAPNVRVQNLIRQSHSPLHTSKGGRETVTEKQRVNNKESVNPWKPEEDQGT